MPNDPRAWTADLKEPSRSFLGQLDQSVASLCSDYISDLNSGRVVPARKVIQDSLWGFIEFSPAEIVVIDSPLLQRLRYVRQLGFAYLLFPNAGYSRFEHSLGICHVIKEFARILNERQQNKDEGGVPPPLGQTDLLVLCLAALLHDVGHLAFSHVSERALAHFHVYRSILDDIRRSLKKAVGDSRKKPTFAELLSVCICSSPSVVKLFEYAHSRDLLHKNPSEAVWLVCQCILGSTIAPEKWFMAEMLSGDMDADKLDYIPRDCMVTGVPLPFDVRRLMLKTRLYSSTTVDGISRKQLAVSVTGARALMDLTVSRTLLREKIYRHPKVAAAEAMYENAIESLADMAADVFTPEILLLSEDEAFLAFLRELDLNDDKPITAQVRQRLGRVQALVKALKERRLLKRAFVFSRQFLRDPTSEKEEEARLLLLMQTPESRRKLREEIFSELQTVLAKLGKSDLCPPGVEFVALVSADLTVAAGGSRHQPLILDADGRVISQLSGWEHLTGNAEWANAMQTGAVLHYVFAPQEVCSYCYVATRNVLAKNHGLAFRRVTAQLAKIHQRDVAALDAAIYPRLATGDKATLRDILIRCANADGNTDEAFFGILETTNPARTIQANEDQVQEKLNAVSTFEGAEGHRVVRSRLEAWLSQFDEAFHEHALNLFLKTTYLNRKAFKLAVEDGIKNLRVEEQEAFPIHLAPLTHSGDFMKYYAQDLQREDRNHPIQPFSTVADAISSAVRSGTKGRCLVVVDDVLGMGKQVQDVLRIWFGERPEHESADLTSEMPSAARDWLLNPANQVVFVFGFGLQEGKQAMEAALQSRKIIAKVLPLHLSSVREGVFGSASRFWSNSMEQREDFRAICQDFGKQLLQERARRKGWTPERLEQRALGYSSASQLTATFYNCPTVTLPILWAKGEVNGRPWAPLFYRRFRD